MTEIGMLYENEIEEMLNVRIQVKQSIERLIFNPHIGKNMRKLFLNLAEQAGIKQDFSIKGENLLLKNKSFFLKMPDTSLRICCTIGGNVEYLVLFLSEKGKKMIIFGDKLKELPNRRQYGYYCAVLEKTKLYLKENIKKWEGIYIKLSLSASPYIVGREI
jgi:hypothetical protein